MASKVIPAKTPAETALARAFEQWRDLLPGDRDVARRREDAFHAFDSAGLPHRRVEAWHYTDLRNLMREAFPLAKAPSAAALQTLEQALANSATALRIVLVDGFFAQELSSALPGGVKVQPLASALSTGRQDILELFAQQGGADPILALNGALMQDGAIIEVAPGAVIEEPLHLVHAFTSPSDAACFTRSTLILGEGARARLAESCEYPSSAATQANACLVVSLADGAWLAHTGAIRANTANSMRFDTLTARLGAGTKFESFVFIDGQGLVRRQLLLRCEGENAEVNLSGVSLLGGHQHADTTLFIEHAMRASTSRVSFRTILDDASTGIFQGRIAVAPEAQKTDAKMLSRAILLSDAAAMNNKPELEIFADDVACGHGATCGGLNAEQLFYLRTRGLKRPEAEALLLEAFASELIDDIGNETLIAEFRRRVRAWLAGRTAASSDHSLERA